MIMSFRPTEEQEKRLNKLAKETGRTKTYYVKKAVQKYLDEMELIYLAHSRAEKVKSGESKTYSLDEVIEENGLSDKI